MISKRVRDILVPIADFPRVARDATVRDAYHLLRRQHTSGGWRFRHMLVFGEGNIVVGVHLPGPRQRPAGWSHPRHKCGSR